MFYSPSLPVCACMRLADRLAVFSLASARASPSRFTRSTCRACGSLPGGLRRGLRRGLRLLYARGALARAGGASGGRLHLRRRLRRRLRPGGASGVSPGEGGAYHVGEHVAGWHTLPDIRRWPRAWPRRVRAIARAPRRATVRTPDALAGVGVAPVAPRPPATRTFA